jgi:hypothetical protein
VPHDLHGDTEQAVPPDASIECLSSDFLASLLGWLSLGAGEQRHYMLPGTETMRTISFSLIPLLVILGSLFSHAAQKAQPTNSPDSIIRELYRVHNNGKGGIFEAKGKKYIYKFFDQKLADLIWKDITQTPEGEVGSLDFDPLYNAQDTGITNFQIGKPMVEGDKSTVLVSFRNFGQRTRIKFEMHNGKEGWRIGNVIYGDKSDLIKILSPLQ